jgi:hypothetical protein
MSLTDFKATMNKSKINKYKINNNNKTNTRHEFNLEKYLLKLLPHERNMITKFKCSNIKLPIETGRWSMTPREERIYHLCVGSIGNEAQFSQKLI